MIMYGPNYRIKATTDNLGSLSPLPFLESYLQYTMRIPQLLVRFGSAAELYFNHTIDSAQDAGERVL